MKKPYPIRIDETKYEQLKKLNIDPSKLFREFIDKLLNDKECPLCGSKLKEQQSLKLKMIFVFLFSLSLWTFEASAERQISIFGITVHGYAVEYWSARNMKNKLSENGTVIFNPQINYSQIDESGSIFNLSLVSDCYANAAVFVGNGKKYLVSPDLSFGYLFGLYMRQFPDREAFGLFRVGLYQFIPTPVVYAQHRIGERTLIRVQSNALITFLDLAWEF